MPSESAQSVNPAGPDPVTKSAAFNPYTADGRSTPLQSQQSTVQSQTGQPTQPRYDINPSPAVLSRPVPTALPVDHGPNLAQRTVGSERLYHLLSLAFALLKGLLVLAVLLVLVQLFVATIFHISGESMLPNFSDGQFILVDKLSYLLHPPERGDVVVIQFPGDPENRKFIKRVIGLPGESVTVKDGQVRINGQALSEQYLPAGTQTTPDDVKILRSDEFFVMGDNRPNSNDSRFFGPVPRDNFIGKSQAILSGSAFGWVAQPAF